MVEPRAADVDRFLDWWMSGLRDCVPRALRSRLQSQYAQPLVEVTGRTVRLGHAAPDGRMRVTHELGLDQRPDAGAQRWLRCALRSGAAVVIRLPEARALGREFALPLAAEETLRESVALQMDRQTPYAAEDVYFGTEVLARNADTGRLLVYLTVAPRAEIDVLVNAGVLRGLRIASAELPTERGLRPVSLDPVGPPTPRVSSGAGVRWLLMLNAALIMAIVAVPLWQRHQLIGQLEREAAAAGAEARRAAAARAAIERLSSGADSLAQRRAQTPRAIAVLDALTRLLPDDAWIQRLDLTPTQLAMQGEAAATPRVIEALEASRTFRNLSFRAPVQSNPETGRERFDLAVEVSRPEPGQ